MERGREKCKWRFAVDLSTCCYCAMGQYVPLSTTVCVNRSRHRGVLLAGMFSIQEENRLSPVYKDCIYEHGIALCVLQHHRVVVMS